MPTDENDDSAMWREYRADQQKRRLERLPRRTEEILSLADLGYEVKRLTQYQFRIERQIDVYPIHRRAHFLLSGRRCTYPANGLKDFIELELAKHNRERTGQPLPNSDPKTKKRP